MTKIQPKQKIKKRKVTFSVNSPDAEKVILMGDFNQWNPQKHPMKKDKNGMWVKGVIIPTGVYEYKFLIDGQWTEDPQSSLICPNCFGTYNNVLALTV